MTARTVASLLAGLLLALPASALADQRITGGKVTTRDWPHMAAMEVREEGSSAYSFSCGGSLVAPDVILTAAHCVDTGEDPDTVQPGQLRFVLGTRKLSSGGERIGATQVLEHPAYDDDETGGHDVALVKLARASTLGRPIRLAEDADRPQWEPGDPATVIGWGAEIFLVGPGSDDLKEVEIPIVSDDDCQSTSIFRLDPATMVCAGNDEGGEDSCQGDSGGPLMVQDAAGAWIQVGAVSFGTGCGFPTQYGVYAEVGSDPLRSWVQDNAAALSSAGASGVESGEPQTTASGDATAPAPATQPTPTPQPQPADARSASAPAALPPRPRVVLASRLGSARAARRRGRVLLRVLTERPLRDVRVVVRQRGRIVAAGRRASVTRTGRLRLAPRRGLRRGGALVTLTARDEVGRRVAVGRRVTLTR